MQTRLNHLGVVEDHQCTLGQILRQIAEHIMRNLSMPIQQQLGTVSLRQRKLGNPLIGQRIVELTNPDMFYALLHFEVQR